MITLKKRNRRQSGFTLLEVMIAVAIMTVAYAAILTSQSGSIHQTVKTKELNLAGWLAKNVITESEHMFEGKPFTELPKVETKAFAAPYERFSWKREIKEMKFPELTQPQKEGQGIPESLRLMVKNVTKFLNDSIREMVVTVNWKSGGGDRSLTLSTYLVDLNVEFVPQQ
jgi:type II secretion system protein I